MPLVSPYVTLIETFPAFQAEVMHFRLGATSRSAFHGLAEYRSPGAVPAVAAGFARAQFRRTGDTQIARLRLGTGLLATIRFGFRQRA